MTAETSNRIEMNRLWHQVRIEKISADYTDEVTVGSQVPVRANVQIGDIHAKEIAVDVYFGVLDSRGFMVGGELVSLDSISELSSGLYQFSGEIECRFCGRQGFMLRVMPNHLKLGPVYEPGLLLWG